MSIDVSEKVAGILVPVFALRRDVDLGIGDTQCVIEAIDFCARNKIGVLQILPINETGGDNSPYNAISSVALDPVLLTMSPAMVPGLTDADLSELAPESIVAELNEGPVHYARVKELKTKLLERAFDRFEKENIASTAKPAANPKAVEDFEAFKLHEKNWLNDYTMFRVLVDEHDGNACWTHWAKELQLPADAEKWASQNSEKERLARRRAFWAYVQWVAFTQWRTVKKEADKNSVKLMGDIPFGVSRYSADVWADRELFDVEWSGGAPPERLFQGDKFTQMWGQNWGIPIYRWKKHFEQKFEWWRQRVSHVVEIFPIFRIDHVLGFFRVYSFPWIPERNEEFADLTEEEAEELTGGDLPQFLPRPDEPKKNADANCKEGKILLQNILQDADQVAVVAEDLGMVPSYVRPLLKEMGIAGFTIPLFADEFGPAFKPKDTIPALTLATYATHDHQPLVTFYDNLVVWWHGPDGHNGWQEMQRLMKFLGLDANNPPLEFTPEVHHAFLKALLESKAWLCVLMITDLLGTKVRFNEPGMSGESCWSQRLDRRLADYESNPDYGQPIKWFCKLIEKTDREPKALACH